uniref:Uncharacterized protein n=1 Tax=Grammatophora oceanica TaxID=210454 RepID=A0A6U5JUC9_9STRA|mmetsp:Transcript_26733/g.39066  ORF Transcript_26733/g.39066 Transcript_26733/m.39066 type:complete len:454 (+) Transcript_26733:186-1547(+)|eukprot:CAMPEP_0194025922 /NCGR_PEP_ID=MMETSP0009_2-20130614/212_1 /TAXON_ID=210454 /ORGANISM="Grammatophora oceanica, Strain CCMP 410" /LENGTH=453 /DNA_ID=CAMNT_0038664321 /DNA_START=160 /DNA_END=1521 /DNA_ORIENTATION=-
MNISMNAFRVRKKDRKTVRIGPKKRLTGAVMTINGRKREASQELLRLFEGRQLWTPPTTGEFDQRIREIATEVPVACSKKVHLFGKPFSLLYLTCVYGCSMETVKAVHRAYPKAIRQQCVAKRLLPLHAAARFGCAVDVLEYLIQYYPEALKTKDNECADSPLQRACYGLYRIHHEVRMGITHKYITIRYLHEKIKYLLRVDPPGVAEQFMPLNILCKTDPQHLSTELMEEVIRASPTAVTKCWEQDIYDSYGMVVADTTEPLTTLFAKPETPESILRLLLEICPDSLRRLPWNKVCWTRKLLLAEHKLSKLDPHSDGRSDLDPASYTKDYPVHAMVRCVESAWHLDRCMRHFEGELNHPDDTGNYALHIGIRHRLSFKALALLAKAEPKAVLTHDPMTGKYPLVAIAGRTRDRDSAETHAMEYSEANHLEAVYSVLRVKPQEIIETMRLGKA